MSQDPIGRRFWLFLVAAVLLVPATFAQSQSSPLQVLEAEAARGDATAQFNLGVELYRGEKVERNLEKAARLWRLAAKSGHVSAHNNLGYLVFFGRGVARDPEEGMRLWRFAAEGGHAEAQFHLASTYMTGRHRRRNYLVAYAWAKTSAHHAPTLAKLGGDPAVAEKARTLMRQARQSLSENELGQAEERAAEFIARYGPQESNK